MEESWRRKWKVVRKWNVIIWKGILPAYRSTMLTACVFVTRDTVRHPRRLVLGKFVRKPNCSLSDAFVNRGLTVLPSTTTIMHILQINNNTFQWAEQLWNNTRSYGAEGIMEFFCTLSQNVLYSLAMQTYLLQYGHLLTPHSLLCKTKNLQLNLSFHHYKVSS